MLTQLDLQQIGQVVENVLETKLDQRFQAFEISFSEKLDLKLDQRFQAFEISFSEKLDVKLDQRFVAFEISFSEKLDLKLDQKFRQELIPLRTEMKRGFQRLQKSINRLADITDARFIYCDSRLERIENHLHLSSLKRY